MASARHARAILAAATLRWSPAAPSTGGYGDTADRERTIGMATTERLWRRSAPALEALHRRLVNAPPQVLLAGGGCMALAASSDIANTFDAPRSGGALPALLLFLALAAAFILFLLATRTTTPSTTQSPTWLTRAASRLRVPERHILRAAARLFIYPLLLWALLTSAQTVSIVAHGIVTSLTTTRVSYGSDDLYYNHYNAWLVLHATNPYTDNRLLDEVAYFHNSAYTPLMRGRFANPRHYPSRAEMDAIIATYERHPGVIPPELDPATMHSYPAGAFLVDVPTVWAGIPSVAFTQILLLLALLAAIVWAVPPGWRVVVALLLLATADGAREVAGADFEIWPLALVAFAWLARERRWTSALLLGVACAIKQTAWIAAPFYLLYIWRTHGRAEALRRLAIAAGAFLAINLPWITASPGAWLSSILLPVSLPLLPDGSGVIGLSLTGILPLLPATAYALLELAALAGALVWYWRSWPRNRFAGLVLPLVPLIFAWRSSERYFVLLPLAAGLALALTLRDRRTEAVRARRPADTEELARQSAPGQTVTP